MRNVLGLVRLIRLIVGWAKSSCGESFVIIIISKGNDQTKKIC